MATRIFRVSIPEGLDLAFTFIAACIDSAGLTIKNPETDKITSWSDEGEQVVTASERILPKINSGELTNVQFWSSSSDDMFVSWSRDGCLSTFSLHLDGVDVTQSVAVASKLIEGLLTKYTSKQIAGDVFAVNFE
ncbi:hypothetical protein G3N95_21345 [Paraburkholderia sp. Tr-20389]|nr:hypothetical protein [Paraburkholderia sp. Tr-20389]